MIYRCIITISVLANAVPVAHRLSAWYWLGFVIVIDLIIFIIVQTRRRRMRSEKAESKAELLSEKAKHLVKVKLPRLNAIYLFGELLVFNNRGEEISAQFSPLLKELMALLLIRSVDGGITSDELTQLLWFDKDANRAKNNRAVNMSRLRQVMADVGGCTIKKENKRWVMMFADDVFVDYYECLPAAIRPDLLTPQKISIINEFTSHGPLLAYQEYLWLDDIKSRLADTVISALMQYAMLLDEHGDFNEKINISNIIFCFDSVSEAALRLVCTTYVDMNRQYMAKKTYEHFCREYRSLYDMEFQLTFNEILSRK